MRKLTDIQLHAQLAKLTAEAQNRGEAKRVAANKEREEKHQAKRVTCAKSIISAVAEANVLYGEGRDEWTLIGHLASATAIIERMFKGKLDA